MSGNSPLKYVDFQKCTDVYNKINYIQSVIKKKKKKENIEKRRQTK